MSVIRLSVGDFPAFILSTHKQRTQCFRWAALATAYWAWQESVKKTDQVGAVDLGRFRSSWSVSKIQSRTILARMSNKAPYAGYVERGLPPGIVAMPTESKVSKAILGWTFRKIGPGVGAQKESDVWGIAHAVQTKLAERGYTGRPILTSPEMKAELITKTRMNIARSCGWQKRGSQVQEISLAAFEFKPDLDEMTAVIDGMSRFLSRFQHAPGKNLRVLNDPAASRDQALDEPPILYIDFDDEPEWVTCSPQLVEESRQGDYCLVRTGEFHARVNVIILADTPESRSRLLLATRTALEPDISQQSHTDIRIPLPRYFGGYTPPAVGDKGLLRGECLRGVINDTPESILSGEYNGNVAFDVEMPVYKAVKLVEGRPAFVVTVLGED